MNDQAHQYVEDFMAQLTLRNPNEPEFHQAVREVPDSLRPVVEANEQAYRRDALLERMVNPERQIKFRVPWIANKAQAQIPRSGRYGGLAAQHQRCGKELWLG